MNDETLNRLLGLAAENLSAGRSAVARGQRHAALMNVRCAASILSYVEMRHNVSDRTVAQIEQTVASAIEKAANPLLQVTAPTTETPLQPHTSHV